MAFDKFEYSKSWRNPSDFPTIETSETQVRDDMQILFDEIAAAHNTLVEGVEEHLTGLEVESLVYSKSASLKYLRLTSNGRLQCSGDGNNWVTILGAKGDAGADGSDGSDGADGSDGSDGTDGSNGSDGADGSGGVIVTYELPMASALALGGVKADPVTAKDTQPVRIGKDGRLYTEPTGGGNSTPGELPANLLTTMGGVMEGPLYLYDDPEEDNEAATKRYVDMAAAGGLKGDKGDKGDTPEIGIQRTTNATIVSFTLPNEGVAALIPDGKDGKDGVDGFSPLISVSKEGKATTISITDAEGTKTATIMDGEDGTNTTGGGESGEGGSTVAVDTTLTVAGAAADAKAVGDRFTEVFAAQVACVQTMQRYTDEQIEDVLGDLLLILEDINGEAADLEEIAETLTEINGEEASE